MVTVEEDLPIELEPHQGWDERIRIIKCGDLVRSYLVKSDDFLLVYDTLLGPLSGQFLRQQALEFADGRKLLVVNSHADWDHYFGNMCFPEAILASQVMVQRLEQGVGEQELRQKRSEFAHYKDVKIKAPTIGLSNEATLHGGDLSFRLLHTRGHRPDHLAVYIPEINTLLPGDCVEDPIPLLDEDSDGSSRTLRELSNSLRRFLQLEPAWVLANHAAPEASCSRIEQNLEYLEKLEELASDCKSPEELQSVFPGDSDWGDFYQKAHQKQLVMAWQQCNRSARDWAAD